MYNSTIVKGVSACDFNGLAYLTCGRENPWKTAPWYSKLRNPIRAVNIGGLFVLEQWILPGFVTWGEKTGIWDQYSFSKNCGKMRICNKLKVSDVTRRSTTTTTTVNQIPLFRMIGQEHWKTWYTAEDFKQMKR